MNESKYDLTNGSVIRTLIFFVLPYLFSSFMQAFYGAVDLFVVGQYTSSSAVSAVTIGSQIMQIIIAVILGLTMGTTVLVGHCIGQKDGTKAAKVIGNTILLFSGIAVLLTPLMVLFTNNLVSIMQTPAEAVTETAQYTIICSIGIPFMIAYNVISSILRGLGDSKTPMYFIGIACIVNVAGDFLLTGLLGFGVIGVAWATTFAQAASSVFGCIYLIKKKLPFPFSKKDIRWQSSISGRILQIGAPIALQDFLIHISFMLITVIANRRGLIASAAVGVVEKIIIFLFLVPSAFSSAISAITAQNIGAEKPERAIKSVKYGIIITVSYGCIACILSQLFPMTFTSIFSTDTNVILAGADYLKTYMIDCILVGATFCLNGYLCGCGKSIVVFIHNTISIFLIRIPVAYLMSELFKDSLLPMGLASPLGSLLSIFILIGYFMVQRRKKLLLK